MPRPTPRVRSQPATWSDRDRQFGEGVAVVAAVLLDDAQRRLVGVLGRQHRVEPVQREVELLRPRPPEARPRGVVVGAVLRAGSRARRGTRQSVLLTSSTFASATTDVTNSTTVRAVPAVSRLSAVIGSGDDVDRAAAAGRRHAERVAVALHDEDRHGRQLQLVQARVLRPARRVQRVGQRDDGPRARARPPCGRRPAHRWTGRRRPAAAVPTPRRLRSAASTLEPRLVLRAGRGRRAAPRDAVGLGDQRDRDAGRNGGRR